MYFVWHVLFYKKFIKQPITVVFLKKYRRAPALFKLFYVDIINIIATLARMIVDMEIKSASDNIVKRAGYLWRFL